MPGNVIDGGWWKAKIVPWHPLPSQIVHIGFQKSATDIQIMAPPWLIFENTNAWALKV
jgi:hypothetical protein